MSSEHDFNRRGWYLRPAAFVVLLAAVCLLAVMAIELPKRFSTSRPFVQYALAPLDERERIPFPREIKDVNGEIVVINSKPQRIVSQTLATDEFLLEICAPERILALNTIVDDETYSNAVEKAKLISGRVTSDAEQILQLKPDLIFIASYSKAEMVELLKLSQNAVFRFGNFDSIEDIKQNLRITGFAIGEDRRAEQLIEQMEREISEIKLRIPKDKRVRVMSYGQSGYTSGAVTTFDDMLKTIGAINVTAEKGFTGFPKISAEQLIEWNPDVIVTGAERDAIAETRESLLKDPAVRATNAGKNRHIIVVPNQNFLSVSHHITKSIRQLADEIYGIQN